MTTFTKEDAIRAHGGGIVLEDPQVRALQVELEGVLDLAHRATDRLDSIRSDRDKWHRRWVWTFGALMGLIVVDGVILLVGRF